MQNNHIERSSQLFYAQLILIGLAIALLTAAGQGTLPVLTPALLLSEITPISFGIWTILFGSVFLGIARLLAPRTRENFLQQILATIGIGLLIDVGYMLFKGIASASFLSQVFFVLVGCLLLAGATYLQTESQQLVFSADVLTNAIEQRSGMHLTNNFHVIDIIGLVSGILMAYFIWQSFHGIGMATFIPPFLVPYFYYLIDQAVMKLEG